MVETAALEHDVAPAAPVDPVLRRGGLLLDADEAAAVMAAALTDVAEVELGAVTPTQVRYQPGRRLAVRYRAEVRRGGVASVDTLVGLCQQAPLPAGMAVLADDDGTQIGVWAYPHDPWLPGLPAAASPAAVRRLLDGLGAPDEPVSVRPLVYRPTARAVLAVDGAARVHLKVVRPAAAASLHAVHRRLAGSLPVPTAIGVDERQGILVLATLGGESLGAALHTGRALPDATAVAALLGGVAEQEPVAPPVLPADAAMAASRVLTQIAPDVAARAATVAAAVAAWPYRTDRTIHGDFYEAQILVADGAVSGLLDVDGLRPGDAVDDVATLLAHLDVLAAVSPDLATRAHGFGEAVRREVAGGDADAVDVRTAATLLSLAAWPFRVQRDGWRAETDWLVGLAERRLRRATGGRGGATPW